MASTFTSNLLLTLMTPGDPGVFNSWGTVLDTGVFTLIDSAIAGVLTIDVTTFAGYPSAVPTSSSGAADQARNAHFKLTGTLTGTTLVLFPTGLNRNFTLNNATSGAFTLDVGVSNGGGGAAGTTVRVPQGQAVFLLSDGTNVTSRFNSFVGGLTVDTLTVSSTFTLSTPLTVPSGGMGAATHTAHGVLVGAGASAIAATTAGTTGQALVSGGASADPAFATLGVIGGGTGLATLTAHAVLIGNGASAPSFVAPGVSGHVLTSDGTDWTSVAPTSTQVRFSRVFTTGASTVAGGTTAFIGPATVNATESNVFCQVGFAGTIRNMYAQASAAPGGSETIALTVRKNAFDTALTCTISAALATATDLTHSFTVIATDVLDILVVSSGAAATVFVHVVIEVDPA